MAVFIGATGRKKYYVMHYRWNKKRGVDMASYETFEFKSLKKAKEYADMMTADGYYVKIVKM